MPRSLIKTLIALCTVAGATLATTQTASADFVPGRSIGDIELGATYDEVVDARGEPAANVVKDHELIGQQRVLRYRGGTKVYFGGADDDATVVSIQTTDKTERYKGVGVGSTERQLKKAISKLTCTTEAGTFRHCYRGRLEPGQRVTDFFINRKTGKANRLTIGFVID